MRKLLFELLHYFIISGYGPPKQPNRLWCQLNSQSLLSIPERSMDDIPSIKWDLEWDLRQLSNAGRQKQKRKTQLSVNNPLFTTHISSFRGRGQAHEELGWSNLYVEKGLSRADKGETNTGDASLRERAGKNRTNGEAKPSRSERRFLSGNTGRSVERKGRTLTFLLAAKNIHPSLLPDRDRLITINTFPKCFANDGRFIRKVWFLSRVLVNPVKSPTQSITLPDGFRFNFLRHPVLQFEL